MFGMIILTLLVSYEGFIIINMKEYCNMTQLLRISKGRKAGDEIYNQVAKDLKSNKLYTTMLFLSYFYALSLVILLFTQYWLVSLVLFALGLVVYKLKNNDDSIYINYLDSITVIIVIVLGVAML